MKQTREVVYKDVAYPKLTVAVDRVSVKFPIGYKDNHEHDLILLEFLDLAEEIGIPEKTLRGRLRDHESIISMRSRRANAPYSRKLRTIVISKEEEK